MSIIYEERPSDSLYIEQVAKVQAVQDAAPFCRANGRWEMVVKIEEGRKGLCVAGPLTKAVLSPYSEGNEFWAIKFTLGTFMPHLPIMPLRDTERMLPDATNHSFWLNGAAWQFFDYDNAETFVERLARQGLLVHDPLIAAVLRAEPQPLTFRTVRRRFLRATGMPQGTIAQIERAQHATMLLEQGVSILDTVEAAGYADQPHLTRAMKYFVGQTPAQLERPYAPA